jgi:general secretion pathway protein F
VSRPMAGAMIMHRFDYDALDASGQVRRGRLKAASRENAEARLRARSLVALEIREEGAGRANAKARLSSRALAMITRQLATLITVCPLEEALRTLIAQTEAPAARRVLAETHAGVLEGLRLSAAMARLPRAWPPLYRAMIAAGESSGSLPEILTRLADVQEREQAVRGRIITALVYPAALALVALVVVAALMTFVVPRVVEQFSSMNQTLPLLTQIVIGASSLMQSFGWLMLLLLLGAGVALWRALQVERFRLGFDRWVLSLPLIGRLIRDLHAARFARMLSTMLDSGLPVYEGLGIVAPTIRNRVLRRATLDMAAAIREGGALSAAMRRVGVFPPILVSMATSGENAGRLGVMLERAADFLEREFNTFTAVALSLMEPAIIIVMGAVVAVIVLSILLPILQINTLTAR